MDRLLRGLDNKHNFRVFICDTTKLSNEAQQCHDTWPTATAALSRVMSVGVIMGANLKSADEKLKIDINGGGPIEKILVDARYDGSVRGLVGEPHVHYQYNETNKLAVGVAVGKDGYLKVTKGMSLKSDFEGQVPLVSGEIAEDFAYYFTVSEQTPSAVMAGCLVDVDNSVIVAGGLLLQVLPNASDEDIDFMEAAINNLKPISELLNEKKSLEQILELISADITVLEEKAVRWECGCSKEQMRDVLYTLSNEDRQELIEENNGCEICCHFCNTHYAFSGVDLQAISDASEK